MLRATAQLRLLRTALLILVVIGLWVGVNYENLRELAQARQDRDAQLQILQENEAVLGLMQRQHRALEHNPEAVERAAREQLQMTLPGETLVGVERETAEN